MANGFAPEMEPAIEPVGEAPKITKHPLSGWTDDRVDLLKKLWAEGLSGAQIASRLGGVTRNAIIGKVHRLGLSGRTTTTRAKYPSARRKVRRKPRASFTNQATMPEDSLPPVPIEDHTDYDPPLEARLTILELNDKTCRWPIGAPRDKDFAYCGRDKEHGSYCKWHGAIAYQPKASRAQG